MEASGHLHDEAVFSDGVLDDKFDSEVHRRARWLMEVVQYGEDWLARVDDDLKEDGKFVAEAVKGKWYAIRHAAPKLKGDHEFVVRARLPRLAEGHAAFKAMPYRVDENYLRRNAGASGFDQRFFDNLKDDEGFVTKIQLMDAIPQKATTKEEKAILLDRVSAGVTGWLAVGQLDVVADSSFMKAVRQRLARNYQNLDSMEQAKQRYDGYGALNVSLDTEATVLVDGEWLLDFARNGDGSRGHGLPRRQDLPPAAIYTGPVFELTVVLGLSYCWSSAPHPDPLGNQLREVARLVEWYMDTNQGKRVVLFWDWCSLPQHAPTTTTCAVVRDDGDPDVILMKRVFGVAGKLRVPRFLVEGLENRPHLLKPGTRLEVRMPRTDAESTTFKCGLGDVNLWYANVHVIKLLLTFLAPEAEGKRTDYDGSGWTTFEKHTSRLISDDEHVINMGNIRDVDLTKIRDSASLAEADKGDNRMLALNPSQFATLIKGNGSNLPPKKFANGSDINFVIKKYKKTFDDVLAREKTLEFADMHHIDPREWQRWYSTVLVKCTHLQYLNLRNNTTLELDVAEFQNDSLIEVLGNLQTLLLSNCTEVYGDVVAFGGLKALKNLDLQDVSKLTGDVGEAFRGLLSLETLVLQSCDRLTGDVARLKGLGSLKTLDIDGCNELRSSLLADQLSELRMALPQCRIYYTGSTETVPLSNVTGVVGAEVSTTKGSAVLSPAQTPSKKDNPRGSTALMLAAEEGNAALVGLLLENDADPFAGDLQGKTALAYAGKVLEIMDKEFIEQQEKLELSMSTTGKKRETLGLQLAMSRNAVAAEAATQGHVDSIKYITEAMLKLNKRAVESRKVNGKRGYAPVLRRRPGDKMKVRQPGEFQLKSHRLAPGDLSDWEGIMEHVEVFDDALNVRERQQQEENGPLAPRPATSGAALGGKKSGRPGTRQRGAPKDARVLEVMRIKMLEDATKAEDRNNAATRAAAAALAGTPVDRGSDDLIFTGSKSMPMLTSGARSPYAFGGGLAPLEPSISGMRVHRETQARKEVKKFLKNTTRPKDPGLTRLIKMRHQGFSQPVTWKTGDSESIFLAGHVPR